MMVWSINLLVLAVGVLIVGMIWPQRILFWLETPRRFPIILLAMVLFMAAAMMFGEANREKQQKIKQQAEQASQSKTDTTVPVVVKKAKTER